MPNCFMRMLKSCYSSYVIYDYLQHIYGLIGYMIVLISADLFDLVTWYWVQSSWWLCAHDACHSINRMLVQSTWGAVISLVKLMVGHLVLVCASDWICVFFVHRLSDGWCCRPECLLLFNWWLLPSRNGYTIIECIWSQQTSAIKCFS
jgi:hypothetical protein